MTDSLTSLKVGLVMFNLARLFRYGPASMISFPFVFRIVRCCCYNLYMSVFLSKLI